MYQSFWHDVLALALAFTSLVCAIDYGVGFSLALDYGTASIHFSNGSAVNMVKIRGGPAYKATMRSAEFWNMHEPERQFGSTGSSRSWKSVTQAYLELNSLRCHLPSWLGGQDYRSQPLSWMVNALKTTTEAYLETPISAAEVVFPFPASDLLYNAVRSTFSSHSLQMPMSKQPPAGILAARAYDIGKSCPAIMTTVDKTLAQDQKTVDSSPEQLVLTVDYSDAALTALLVFEECNIFEYRRVLHDTSIGSSAPSDTRLNDLVHALRNITDLPLRDGNGAGLTQINGVVLLGERPDDRYLHEALRVVLGQRYGAVTLINNHKNECSTSVVSPLFAASRGVAQDCWDRLNFSGPETEDVRDL